MNSPLKQGQQLTVTPVVIQAEVVAVGEGFMTRSARVRLTLVRAATGERITFKESTVIVGKQYDNGIMIFDAVPLLAQCVPLTNGTSTHQNPFTVENPPETGDSAGPKSG